MATYPSSTDYLTAVQSPTTAFTDATFADVVFDVHPLYQVPVSTSGASALVFRAEVRGHPRALRVFLREPDTNGDRYETVLRHVQRSDPEEHVVRARWHDDGIVVAGRTWPLVEMDWVAGPALDEYVRRLVRADDRLTLALLSRVWRRLVADLQRGGLAHGRLEHANVLVDEAGGLRLVDLDDVWVDGLVAPSFVAGHPNYQHPQGTWGRWMDTFPALVIYLSLRALARSIELWDRFHEEEGLIVSRADLRSGTSALWKSIDALHDPELDVLMGRLREFQAAGPPQMSLEAVITGRPDPEPHDPDPAPVPQRGPIFLSYAREDQARVRELADQLEQEGRTAWVDITGAVPGQDWREQVMASIRRADALVLMITRYAMASRSVRREVEFADSHDIPVYPVVCEDVELPDWYLFAFNPLQPIEAADGAALRRAAKDIVTALDGR